MKKLLVLLCLATLSSCLTDRKLGQHARRYYAEHPDLFAWDCAGKFPTQVLPGTVIHTSDTTILPGIEVPCPDQLSVNPVTGDTTRTPGKTISCPPSKIIHDTLRLHDTILPTALIEAFKYDTAAKGQALRIETAKKNEAEDKAKKRLYWVIGLGAIIVGAGAWGLKSIIS